MSEFANTYAGATNITGFTALPAGYRGSESSFSGLGESCNFWIVNSNNYHAVVNLRHWSDYVDFYSLPYDNFKRRGYSVRCVKD